MNPLEQSLEQTLSQTVPTQDYIIDVNTDTFVKNVIEASQHRPIIIQFWADWCEPCKQLAPNLESAVALKNGDIVLARLDIGANKQLAEQMQVKSVPTVACVYQGKPVDGFTGNISPSEIEEFINAITEKCPIQAQSNTADITPLIETASTAIASGDFTTALPLYMEMLELVPYNPIATAGLAKCYIHIGELDAAKDILDASEYESHDDIIGAKKMLDLALKNTSSDAQIDAFAVIYRNTPTDMENGLSYAKALFASSDYDNAITILLDLFKHDKAWSDGAIKKELLQCFEVLGFAHPLSISGRKKLSSLLFV